MKQQREIKHYEYNKKLGYHIDSTHLRSLSLSASFNVIDFDTNRKPVCDFMLVNNANLQHI